MKKIFLLLCPVVSLALFTACGGDSKDKTDDTPPDTLKSDVGKGNTYKIYSLPAPLQIPNAINELKTSYSEEFLRPTNIKPMPSATNFEKAISIGIYGIDAGYTMLFNQNQTSIQYMSKIARLSDELKITGAFAPDILKRLKENINNRDSATYIILSSFNSAQKFLRENNREDAGLHIATGSFIEGLHISIQVAKKQQSKELMNIIGSQKLFLENIIELLAKYQEQQETATLLKDLSDLKTIYDSIEITYEATDQPNTRKVTGVSMTDEQFRQVGEKVSALRKSLVE